MFIYLEFFKNWFITCSFREERKDGDDDDDGVGDSNSDDDDGSGDDGDGEILDES